MSWELAVALDPAGAEPLFLQIARALADDVRRGRLRAGALLPGSRVLARSLEVHRNTVLAAYRELGAEGWVEASEARGTFVAAEVPEPRPRRFSASAAARTEVPARAGFDLAPGPSGHAMPQHPKGTLSLSGGVPDLRLAPAAALARAYRRALHHTSALDYGDPQGEPRLRAGIAAMLSAVRGLASGPE